MTRIAEPPWRRLGVFVFWFVVVFLTHLSFLRTPYYWDEIGQFVPASLDIYRNGWWVPRSTLPNIHPPAVMAYLAGVWKIAGYSLAATRSAMIMFPALGLVATWLLAQRLIPGGSQKAGWIAATFLFCCPLFFSQSTSVLLDLPAMAFTAIALYLFLNDRLIASALACVALVLIKETGLVLPAVLAAWTIYERRSLKPALVFLAPALALAAWLLVLQKATGSIFGNREFATYNLSYPMNPIRILGSLFRRFYYLAVANGHWLGWVLVWQARRLGLFRTREWRIAGSFALLHILTVTIFGGAVLERYLLPVLPVLYAAFAQAITDLPKQKTLPAIALPFLLLAGNWINPPYPFPYENNLAWTDAVALEQQAARFLDDNCPEAVVTTAWPLTDALRTPDFFFVRRPHKAQLLNELSRLEFDRIKKEPELVALYSRTWDPPASLLHLGPITWALTTYWGYQPDVRGAYLAERFGMVRIARWEKRGQWLELWSARGQSQGSEKLPKMHD